MFSFYSFQRYFSSSLSSLSSSLSSSFSSSLSSCFSSLSSCSFHKNQLGPITLTIFKFSNSYLNEQNNLLKNKKLTFKEQIIINKLKENGRIYSALQYQASRVAARITLEHFNIYSLNSILNDSFGAPQFPSNVSGSISHKNNFVLCGIIPLETSSSSNNNNNYNNNNKDNDNVKKNIYVGVDIEQLGRKNTPKRLGERILTENELKRLGCSGLTIEDEILLRFSLKESVYKAIFPFVKKHIPFKDVEVEPTNDGFASIKPLFPITPSLKLTGYYQLYKDNDQEQLYCVSGVVIENIVDIPQDNTQINSVI